MKRARFTEEQIISVLKEYEAGAKTADLARKHGISEATIYNWKAKFGGMDVSEAKRLRALEENAQLARTQPSTGTSSHRESRCRTALSRASTAGCATNCSTRPCL